MTHKQDTPAEPVPPQNTPPTDEDFAGVRAEMASMSLSQEETDRRARIEYLRSITGHEKPKRGKTFLKILLTVVIIAGLAAGVFWYFSRSGAQHKASQQPTKQDAADNQTDQQHAQVQTKHYDSAHFSLGFDYSEDWKVTDSGNGKLTVVSPEGTFKTVSGTVKAQIVLTIQSKQATIAAFKNANGLATRTSQKLAYTKPTPNQRAETYLTFVNNTTTSGTLNGLYVTGDLGYQKDQYVPVGDIVKADPLVSYTFVKCNNTSCPSDPTTDQTAIADSAWADSNTLVKRAVSILTSLAIN